MIEKIILKKSAVLDKMPTPEQLEYGEIALNFNTMNPFISFKDTADGIRQIKDYSDEIQNINGSLTDAKNEINYLRTLSTDNHTNLMFLRGDFEDFKADNTNTINVLDRNVSQNSSEIATLSTSVDKKVDKSDITQSTGTSETAVMSQKAVSDALSTKVDKSDIVQSTGTSTTAVMSQKASTDSFIANTPSGDPMHNMYVAMGAMWNGTGVDKTYPTPWADYAEDEEDKVYVHKNGCWAYCYVGDLTSKDMADIAILPKIYHAFPPFFATNFNGRAYASNLTNAAAGNLENYTHEYKSGFETFFTNIYNEVIVLIDNKLAVDYYFDDNIYTFAYSRNLRCIWGAVQFKGNDVNVFIGSKSLKFVFLQKLGINMSFKDCPKLSKHCVRYMIENATDATITITLHPEAYDRAIADAGVQTALANKTNVSLAKAE